MKETIKRAVALLSAAAIMLLCCACSVSGGGGGANAKDPYSLIPESTAGKDIERAKAADEVFSLNYNTQYSFNPLVATYHTNQLVCSLVYENMVELDNNFEVHPNVISSWSCSEDGKFWTFNIDPNYTFHDGTKVTGKDLRYSLDRCIYADRYAGRFASYQGAGYTDTQLTVSLGVGDTQFVKLMNIPIIKYNEYSKKFPIGCGPYMFAEYTEPEEGAVSVPTQLQAFEAHPDYAKLPVETVYLREYPTPDGTISAFEDSIVDVAINDPSSALALGYASTNESRAYATTNMHFVAFNEETTLGRYSNFRFAMNYAFDRRVLVQLLKDFAVATPIPMYPTCSTYPDELAESLNYNLEKCKQILYNAGMRDYDGDGKLEVSSDSSQKVELNFLVCSESSAKVGVASKFVEDMASIGITVHLYQLGWEDYINVLKEGQYEIMEKTFIKMDMYYGEIKLRNNFDLTELLDVDVENKDRSINYTHSKDSTYELLMNEYLVAGTDMDRYNKYYKFCEYLTQMGGLITIGFEKQEIVTHSGVIKGIDSNMGNPLYGFADWTMYLTEDNLDSRQHREASVPVVYPGQEEAETEESQEGEETGEDAAGEEAATG